MESVKTACLLQFDFRSPFCDAAPKLLSSLSSSSSEPRTSEFMKDLVNARASMMQAVNSSSMAPADRLRAIDEYLPMINHFHNSLEQQRVTIRYDCTMEFTWSGSIHASTGGIQKFQSNHVEYEILMVLHSKAIIHHIYALKLLKDDSTNNLNEAGKNFREAASVMDFMARKIGGGWNKAYNLKMLNPTEIVERTCTGLAAMFKTNAQSVAIAKVIVNPATSPLLLSKLCASAYNSAKVFHECVMAGSVHISPDLIMHSVYLKEFFGSLAYFYCAKDFKAKNEIGCCIAFCKIVQAKLTPQSSGMFNQPAGFAAQQVPQLRGKYQSCAAGIGEIVQQCNELSHSAEQENRIVYFQSVPTTPDEMPELPPEATVVAVPSMSEPVYTNDTGSAETIIEFEYKKKPGLLGSLMGGLKKSVSSSGKVPSTTKGTDDDGSNSKPDGASAGASAASAAAVSSSAAPVAAPALAQAPFDMSSYPMQYQHLQQAQQPQQQPPQLSSASPRSPSALPFSPTYQQHHYPQLQQLPQQQQPQQQLAPGGYPGSHNPHYQSQVEADAAMAAALQHQLNIQAQSSTQPQQQAQSYQQQQQQPQQPQHYQPQYRLAQAGLSYGAQAPPPAAYAAPPSVSAMPPSAGAAGNNPSAPPPPNPATASGGSAYSYI